jgi:hypothetical protein
MHGPLVFALLLLMPGQPPPAAAKTEKTDILVAEPTWTALGRGQDLWFDRQSKRVIARAKVVLREGMLEHLLCLKGTKEHEAILATEAVPNEIHAALLLTGATPGHPVRFEPKFEPPAGSAIGIELSWIDDGKLKKADAREWVRDEKLKAPLAIDWVFAGSYLYEDNVTKKTHYAADDGDMITVANFGSAILDLPIASSASDSERVYVTNTDRIPRLGTEVFMTFFPRPAKPVDKAASAVKPRP